MATPERVKSRNEMSVAQPHSPTCSEVIETCLAVYAAMYREEITTPLAIGYREALKDFENPKLLHAAFMRAMRSSTFRPTAGEIVHAYRTEFENAPKPKQLELPQISIEERAEIGKYFDELREKLRLPTPASITKRRSELQRQAQEILKKYPKKT